MGDYTPTTEQVRSQFAGDSPVPAEFAVFDRWLNAERARIWAEGYSQGKKDERMASELQVGIGLGGYAPADRSNPYEVDA